MSTEGLSPQSQAKSGNSNMIQSRSVSLILSLCIAVSAASYGAKSPAPSVARKTATVDESETRTGAGKTTARLADKKKTSDAASTITEEIRKADEKSDKPSSNVALVVKVAGEM